ncbi:MAG: hypothetical protein CM15mP8_2790 [Methanobacteriota archaeon]|nr:MAG: hypothetical protein CM15mP8_2790 [Euryarchaeota archaeon]
MLRWFRMSAKEGEGFRIYLQLALGLAERFLEDGLTGYIGPAMGTVLEMRDEVGMGKTKRCYSIPWFIKSWDK